MGIEALYATLGVRPGAGPEEIRRAYRRLALRVHPDRRRDDPEAHERFVALATAYRRLMDLVRTPASANSKECPLCGDFAPLYAGTDGIDYCGGCLLGRARRQLPHPMIRRVRFVGVVMLLVGAVLTLLRGVRTDGWGWYAGALVLVGGAMAWLAAVTIRTVHVYDRRLPVSSPGQAASD